MKSVHSFKLKTALDLFQKSQRDLQRFHSSLNSIPNDFMHQSDHAFNFVVTVWHIAEWVWKEKSALYESPYGCINYKSFVAKLEVSVKP